MRNSASCHSNNDQPHPQKLPTHFGHPDADVPQAKAVLAGRIIGTPDDEGLSTLKAQAHRGVNQPEFVRIRNGRLGRFTIDRLLIILNKLNRQVDVQVTIRPLPKAGRHTEATV